MWTCNFCAETFESLGKFSGHRSGHSRRGEIPKYVKHSCKDCNQTFENGLKLRSHRRIVHLLNFDDLKDHRSKKQFIIRELGHVCEVCKLSEWMSKPIPIEIDHIDGNPENNARENLRLICPNCHAQTDTYKGKNIGKVQNSRRKQTLKKQYGKYR